MECSVTYNYGLVFMKLNRFSTYEAFVQSIKDDTGLKKFIDTLFAVVLKCVCLC